MYGLRELAAVALVAGTAAAIPQYGAPPQSTPASSVSSAPALPSASTFSKTPVASASAYVPSSDKPKPSGKPADHKTDDCEEKDLKHYFSFGASFTQTMFMENGTQPSVQNPMGNPSIPGKTFTGGMNYVGYLTTKYNSSLVYNYNFARGGATTSNKVVATGPESTTFEDQVHKHFMPKYTTGNKTWDSNNTFFSFHFGINDITIPIVSDVHQQADRFTRVPAILDHYFTYIEDLYKVGARRFMMINVPPQDRTPMILAKNETVQKEMKDYVIEYNAQLLNRTQDFVQKHADANAVYYDANKFFSQVLDDPAAFGFPDATCIDDKGERCIWFNNFHPGKKFDDVWSGRMKVAMDMIGYAGAKPASGYVS